MLNAVAPPAAANPKPLPFSYLHAIQPEGAFELETYTDMTPVRVARETDDGSEAVTGVRAELQVELEVGVAEGLEFGWYFVFRQGASGRGAAIEFKGLKQRLRWQLAPEGEWPIDVSLYGEIAELDDEIELEQKLILSKRLGAWRFAINLWFEQEYYFQDDLWKLVYHPTAGFTHELSPTVALGLEYWVRGRFDDNVGAPGTAAAAVDTTDPVHYLGPTLMLVSPGPWFSLGAYVRLDGLPDAAVVGDPYGKLWFRAIVGFDL
ncbi:MAG: hypothetical protein IT385_00885 [Deltaproteobacteria bacterium]|nr:hypothetical protein [Deltaproteobacteria bacterium]